MEHRLPEQEDVDYCRCRLKWVAVGHWHKRVVVGHWHMLLAAIPELVGPCGPPRLAASTTHRMTPRQIQFYWTRFQERPSDLDL